MIARHCGQRLVTYRDEVRYFIKRCPKCGKKFRQGKRLPKKE